MKYMGSKANHADEILKVVLAKRRPGQTYVEPFIGGANVMVRVPPEGGPRIGADVSRYMIALHRALAAGWRPPETMTEEQFFRIRNNKKIIPQSWWRSWRLVARSAAAGAEVSSLRVVSMVL